MRTILANTTGTVRRVQVNGRRFLVAPVTMIVPGVLAGSNGPLYYPPEEVGRDPQRWNGVPLTLGHPRDSSGNPVSGRSPEVLNTVQLGHVYRTRWDGKTLRGEAWFDEELTRKNGPEVLTNLLQGKVTELSTGLFTDDEPVDNGRDPVSGKPYTHVARNYRPDHLAVLVGVKGACSVDDGCGVLVNKVHPVENAKYRFDSEKCPSCGAAMEGDPDNGRCNRCGKKYGKLITTDNAGADCGIGAGGFQEGNTCAGGGGGSSNAGKPKLTKKALSNRATELLGRASKASGDEARNLRAAAHGYNRAAKHLEDGNKAAAKAVALTAGEFESGKRKLKANRSQYQPHSSDTGRFKKPNAGTGKADTRDGALLGAMVLTDDDLTLGTAAAIFHASSSPNSSSPVTPPWATDKVKWDKATTAAAKSGEPVNSHRYYSITSHIYRSLGGVFTTTTKNAFCPTGEGGGVDPSCSLARSGSGRSTPSSSESRQKAASATTRASNLSTELISVAPDAQAEKYASQARKAGRLALAGIGTAGGTTKHHRKAADAHEKAAQIHREAAKRYTGKGSVLHKEAADAHATAMTAHRAAIGQPLQANTDTGKGRSHNPSSGLGVSPGKACKILHDGAVHGRPLTERQRGMFGARCGQRKKGRGPNKSKKLTSNFSEGLPMTTKTEAIKTLTANCLCWKGKDEILEAMDDGLVEAIYNEYEEATENALVINELREEFGAGEDEVALNEMPAFFKKKVKAKAKADPDDDDDDDDDDATANADDEYKKNQGTNNQRKDRGESTVTVNKASLLEALKGLSQDEILSLPGMSGLRERDQLSQQILNTQKTQLIDRLTENLTDEKRRADRRVKLGKLSLNELMDRVEDLPQPATRTGNVKPPTQTQGIYLGAGPTGNSGSDDDFKPKPMVMPTINWAEEKKILDAQGKVRAE